MRDYAKTSAMTVSVLVLGGAGAMGKVAAATIEHFPEVSEVVIADIDEERAQRVAATMGEKVKARRADGLDHRELVEIFRSYDYVISTLGPFYLFGPKVLSAAIEAEIDYIDICDDWEPTLGLLELNEKAKTAGVRALVGGGASPGISNMLGVKALAGMDSVETLYTGWGATSRHDEDKVEPAADMGGAPAAAIMHWVQQFSGKITVQKDGVLSSEAPLQKHVLPHPEGGWCSVYTLGHPEPVTFPKYFPEIRNSYNVMDMSDFVISLLKSLKRRVDKKELDIRQAAMILDGVTQGVPDAMRIIDYARYGIQTIREELRCKKYMPELHATVVGEVDGKPLTRTVWMNGTIPGGMGEMTCIPTAVFLAMMIQGDLMDTGVYAPEAHADPDIFFEKLKPYLNISNKSQPILRIAETQAGTRQ